MDTILRPSVQAREGVVTEYGIAHSKRFTAEQRLHSTARNGVIECCSQGSKDGVNEHHRRPLSVIIVHFDRWLFPFSPGAQGGAQAWHAQPHSDATLQRSTLALFLAFGGAQPIDN